MDPESKRLLEENLALTQENNKMLHTLKSAMLWSRVMSVLYWVLIIGSALGAYYFVQPYIDQLLEVYGGAKSNLDSIGSMFNSLTN